MKINHKFVNCQDILPQFFLFALIKLGLSSSVPQKICIQLVLFFFRTLKLWDMEDKKEEKVFKGHTGWIRAVAISPDERTIASGSADKFNN